MRPPLRHHFFSRFFSFSDQQHANHPSETINCFITRSINRFDSSVAKYTYQTSHINTHTTPNTMPPKKTDGAAAKAKPAHGTYQDMITDAIVAVRFPFLFSPSWGATA